MWPDFGTPIEQIKNLPISLVYLYQRHAGSRTFGDCLRLRICRIWLLNRYKNVCECEISVLWFVYTSRESKPVYFVKHKYLSKVQNLSLMDLYSAKTRSRSFWTVLIWSWYFFWFLELSSKASNELSYWLTPHVFFFRSNEVNFALAKIFVKKTNPKSKMTLITFLFHIEKIFSRRT